MDKKRNIIIISICVIIAIAIIIVAVCVSKNKKADEDNTDENNTKLDKVYEKMMKNSTYSISIELDENNKYTVSRKNDKACTDTYADGNHTTSIVKDGKTILLMYSNNTYYEYQNNETGLTELSDELDEIIKSGSPEKGEEQIEGKTYKYEEYKDYSYFAMNINSGNSNSSNVSTRFYFKGDKLQYIKTIVGDKSELLKVDVSYDVKDNIFNIPSEFKEG